METKTVSRGARSKTRVSAEAPPVHNGVIAELLARQADEASGHLARAFRRASRSAFFWPVEAAELILEGRSPTELPSVGPYLEKIIKGWIDDPPPTPEPPPIRQHFLTLTQANRILAMKPAWARAYRGDLQMHSTWSDGAASIEEMALEASQRGYEYIAITDHAKGLKIAGGIDEKALARQAEEVREVNEKLESGQSRLRVLQSIELNLSPEGQGDMDPLALAKLDLVLGSFHSALRKKEDQTERYLAALRNPDIQILGHPRGRVYNYRIGLQADWPRVFAEAAGLDKAVELDSYSDRQDLDINLLLLARESGVRVSINTDAHAPSQLGFVNLGLAAALLAGIPKERIINFMSSAELLAWVQKLRSRT